jgi:2-polyprenyl-6-methoxyphenol hydroxylase-like FAD-dependent oxidoreductase
VGHRRRPEQHAGPTLYQRYDGTRHYLGTLPTGLGRSSVFWSIRERDIEPVMARGVDAWRDQARPFAGELDYLLDRVTHLMPARYRHVHCRRPDATTPTRTRASSCSGTRRTA